MSKEKERTITISFYREDITAMCGFETKYIHPRDLYQELKTLNLKPEDISFLWLNDIQQSDEQIKHLIGWVEDCRKEEENEQN